MARHRLPSPSRRMLVPAVLLLALALSAGNALAQGPLRCLGQTLYVPVYSQLYTGKKAPPVMLSVTLNVRNADPGIPITLTGVTYYDSDGRKVAEYLDAPRRVGPLASAEFHVPEEDRSGSGAGFLVRWKAEAPALAPVVESVHLSVRSSQGVSFISPSRIVEQAER